MRWARFVGCLALLFIMGRAGDVLATAVLDPSQNQNVRRVVGPRGHELGEGWSIDRWAIAQERVDIELLGPGAQVTVALRGERATGGDEAWRRTRQGWIRSTPGLPPSVLTALTAHLDRPGTTLGWRVPEVRPEAADGSESTLDPAAVEADLRSLRARVEARLQGTPPPAESLPPEVTTGLRLLLGGDTREAARRLQARGTEDGVWPAGAYSVLLAAGHRPRLSLPALLERMPREPRLLAMLAERAFEEGRYDAAAWWLDAALKTPVGDGEVLRLARLFGWTRAPAPPGFLPSDGAAEAGPLTSWTLVGLLAWLLFAVAAWRRRRWGLGLALVVALAGAFTAVGPRPAIERPDWPPSLVHPLAGDPCEASPTRFDGHGLLVHLQCARGEATILATPRTGSEEAYAFTPHHALGIAHAPGAAEDVIRAAARFEEALEIAEVDGFRIENLDWTETPRAGQGWPDWRARSDPERNQHRVVAGLMAGAWVLLLLAMASMLRQAAGAWARHRRTRWWLLGALVVSLAAHWFAPERMVMVFGGYDLTSHLVDGEIPRYGAGATWLYGPLLWTFGHDHGVLQGANRLLGWLLVIGAWDLGRRLHPSRPRAMAIAAWAMALMPVIWRAHSSESIVVGPALLVILAMRALSLGEDARPGEAAFLGAAAATVRPEIALIVLVLPVWAWLSRRPGSSKPLATWAAAAGVTLVVALQIASVVTTARDLSDSGALPSLEHPLIVALGSVLWVGIFANLQFTPLGLIPLIAAGWLGTRTRRGASATLGLALAWVVLTSVDLVEVSVPRLHTPALLLALPLVGVGWEQVESWLAKRRWSRASLAGLALILAMGTTHNGIQLFRPTNEDVEETLWRDAVANLPVEARCLSVMGYGDPPTAGKTPRHNPLYLLRARHAHVKVTNLTELRGAASCEGAHYVLLGLRCYADLREDGRPQPTDAQPLPACARVLREDVGEAVFERQVSNHGDTAFDLYPDAPRLTVGLYTVTRPPQSVTPGL